jgi:hypothetical membrane protein
MLRSFTDKYPLVGPFFWIASLQYYLVQLIVSLRWTYPTYSWAQNTISDLGNSHCGIYGARIVCSPFHDAMNGSFIVLGITMMAGCSLVYQEFYKTRFSEIGFICMALSGFGAVLVGSFPENTVAALHVTGAALAFLLGNIALVIFGLVLNLPTLFKRLTLAAGILALIAAVLFVKGTYLGLGNGGMERVTAYPQTIWLIIFGIYTSRTHSMRRKRSLARKQASRRYVKA